MTSNAVESSIFEVKPSSVGILLQFQFTVHILIAAAFLYPEVQQMILNAIRSFYPVTSDMLMIINSAPAILVLLHAVYLFAFETSREYILTNERLIIRYGIFLRVEDEVELYRIVDVTQSIGLIQRMFGVGNLTVTSTDRTGTVIMPAIKGPSDIRNAIRTEAEECKNRRGSIRILE